MTTHSIVKAKILKILAIGATVAVLAAGFAVAQQPAATPYEPKRGQIGKDVMWIPTPDSLVGKLLDMAKVTRDDTVIDLGSGDGRMVIAAAKRGAKAIGIEYNPNLVEFAKQAAAKEGVTATFIHGDIFKEDFTHATVLTLFLLDELNLQLRPIILNMKPGTRVVSNTFTMGDWTPDEIVRPGPNCGAYCQGFFWTVPAKVEGTWQTPGNGELILFQSFQMLTGSFRTPYGEVNVIGKLTGNDMTLLAGGVTYVGKVDGNAITATGKSGTGDVTLKATR
ncbi:MAG: methyltransferase domain-containing protein [Betaproteobacteria bacterium]